VHHVGILYDQFMMHGQRNIKLYNAKYMTFLFDRYIIFNL